MSLALERACRSKQKKPAVKKAILYHKNLNPSSNPAWFLALR
jgi:hypothetical protein